MPEIVTPDDVKGRYLGGDIPASDDDLVILIGDVLDAIERDIPALNLKVAAGEIPERRLKRIVSRVVIRHVDNPRGYRSINNGTGPFTDGITYAGENLGEIEVTDSDLEDLVPGFGKQAAFMVDMMPEEAGRRAYPNIW